ncbi:dihydropteroate synthase [Deinococcus aquiradiocola]|uniref:Dihydropteroate synthase n=1 Tax=Deinococcus aquiradiocola TaxID=393059 RepID=A0A917UVS1_9DEIO|nr:dihydropteroate synthase [Deinococcus aquiradiocola]GGJ88793.1 dihydropteroate synthase [Deinococcus aquiradiocola]
MTFRLDFARPVPGAARTPHGWRLSWDGCAVMGILNVTPDSFSDGGRHATLTAALAQARAMLGAGALVLDVGGESTRPGADPVPAETELDRILPVLRELSGWNAVLSVDTLKPEVAEAALRAGAHLVNDVSGLRDPQMTRVCADAGAAACIMHMQGEPRSMQHAPRYDDVTREVHAYLHAQASAARAAGVPGVLLDPGLGFGKTLAHNVTLLRDLPDLTARPDPVLVGASRKRFVGTLGGAALAGDRDAGSVAVHLHAARCGAAMVRVHDVAAHTQALRVQAAVLGQVPLPE